MNDEDDDKEKKTETALGKDVESNLFKSRSIFISAMIQFAALSCAGVPGVRGPNARCCCA